MPNAAPFVEEVLHLLQSTEAISARRMFGGHGIFHNGRMFALIADNELYLKADPQTVEFYVANDLPPFSYSKADGKKYTLSYYLAPESIFEDSEQCQTWAERAQQAAARAATRPHRVKTKKHP